MIVCQCFLKNIILDMYIYYQLHSLAVISKKGTNNPVSSELSELTGNSNKKERAFVT